MIAFAAKGTFTATNGASINLPYVGGIAAGNLLIIQAISVQEALTIGDVTLPSGWTHLVGGTGFQKSPGGGGANYVGSYRTFYKIADGTESGNVTVARTGGSGGGAPPSPFGAQMYRFTGTRITLGDNQVNILGDGNGTITWPACGGPAGMTKIAMVGQRSADPGNPSGFTAQATDNNGSIWLELADIEGTSGSSGATGSGGNSNGWATSTVSFFEAKGRNQILN